MRFGLTFFLPFIATIFFINLRLLAQENTDAPTVPDGARVTLSSDKKEYYLGENILIHFKLESRNGNNFNAEFGGDRRGVHRHLRFKVSATDAQGTSIKDPYPSDSSLGGAAFSTEITASKPFESSIPIVRYLWFQKPGKYSISIHHDCGWQETNQNKYPKGHIEITLKKPTKNEAKVLVTSWLKDKPKDQFKLGKKRLPFVDFSQIRHNDFTELLFEKAKGGDRNAIIGLGSIPTPKATARLISLMNMNNQTISIPASFLLCRRLTTPNLARDWKKSSTLQEWSTKSRSVLMKEAWSNELALPAKKAATAYLKSSDTCQRSIESYLKRFIAEQEKLPQK